MDLIKIALVDDHQLFRAGIKALFSHEQDIDVILDAGDGEEFLDKLNRSSSMPDLVLLDIRMPKLDGYGTVEQLVKKYPLMKIIILTMHQEERHIIRMIEMGVNGYLMKNKPPDDVVNSIRFVMEHDYYFDHKVSALMRKVLMYKGKSHYSGQPIDTLTERESEVLTLICKEFTAKEIAEKLFISFRTVEGHRKHLLNKLNVRNTAGLVVFALKNELVAI